MTSLNVAKSFLSHIGFSHSDASDLMTKFHNNMSRLMLSSHQELIQNDLSIDLRLRLLRAIRCFHKEKWSKYLMNNFPMNTNQIYHNDPFEKLIYHLIKYHIWIIYTSWTLNYIRNSLIIIDTTDHESLQLFYDKIQRLKKSIFQLNQRIILIRKHLS
ncbi:hypothetical protein I4U23_002717 [Adineta vaga]|nr:hypothetical protein I4U23_002717 [Adineta vaga]